MKKKSKKKTTAGKLLSKSKQRKGRQVHYLFVTVIALLLLIDLPFFMFAGNVRDSIPDYPVKGKMIDEKGKPLPGVTILLDSTQIGTVTGHFLSGYPRQKEHWCSLLSGMKMPRRTS